MTIGSFEFVADPNEPSRCSEKCPHYKWHPWQHHHICEYFGLDIIDKHRSRECLAAEKHEAERPAKWLNVFPSVNASLCSACGALTTIEPKPKQCPHCGRKMEG